MKEIQSIYKAVKNLTKRFGRKFTPDGVLVGTLGEVLAEEQYELELLPPKAQAFDAVDSLGRKVLIRCNQQKSTPIKKSERAQILLAIKLLPDGTIEEIFNGPISMALELTIGRRADSSGFVGLSHKKLRKLMESVPSAKRIPLRK